MRKISDQEKKFLEKLIKISKKSRDVYLGSIIDEELVGIEVFIDYQKQTVAYKYNRAMYDQNPSQFIEMTREFSWQIRKYIQLLKDLENAGMLFLYQESPIRDYTKRFGRLSTEIEKISSIVSDQNAIDSIIEYSKKTIIINDELTHFVENDFRTKEEIRYEEERVATKKSLKTARNTLYVTIVALVLTMIISLFQIFNPTSNITESDNKYLKKILSVVWYIHDDNHKKDSEK